MDMRRVRRSQLGRTGWVALAIALVPMIAATDASAKSTPRRTLYAKVSHACQAPKPGDAACFALVREPVSSAEADAAGVRPYAAGAGASESGPAGGLTPEDLEGAYGYDSAVGGAGQTIAIVDAYDDPSVEADLATFDANYGIAPCTSANGCFTKVSQTGSKTSLPEADTTGWSVEISLDVEMAHSTCPNCKILLVEAKDETFKNLATAVAEAASLKATEISNSYGGPEGELGTVEKAAYNQPGIVIAAATGDDGYDDWTVLNEGYVPPARPNVPASLASVVAVGGTTLELGSEGGRERETVWNGTGPLDDFEEEGATGGGCSTLFAAQPWQRDAPGFAATGCGGKRLSADISADANPYTGFDIYDSYDCGSECEAFKRGRNWLTIGGTSLATPLIGSLYALAGGSHGVEYPSLTLYGHLGDASSLYDVTEGGNGYCDAAPEFECGHPDAYGALVRGYALDVDCEYTTACDAAPGFDGPSGVGTPNGLSLFEPLQPTASIVSPTSTRSGLAASFSATASSDPYPGASLSYRWSWGDGTPESSGATPQHTYSVPGEYTVTLTVSDNYGFKSTPATAVVSVTGKTEQELREEHERAEQEAATKRKAEEELATAKRVEEEAAANSRKTEEEAPAAAKKRAEEEAAAIRNRAVEEAAAIRTKAEEEAAAKAALDANQGVSAFKGSLAVPDAQLASTSLQVSAAGFVTLRISCPTGESTCAGSLVLRTLDAVLATRGHAARTGRSVLTLATGSFSVAGGESKTVTLRLSPRARALLARVRTLRARATLLAHDPLGASHTTQTIVTLRAPAASKRKG
jgi:PKD repeat protein